MPHRKLQSLLRSAEKAQNSSLLYIMDLIEHTRQALKALQTAKLSTFIQSRPRPQPYVNKVATPVNVNAQVFNNFSKVIHKLSTFFPHLSTFASEKPSGKAFKKRTRNAYRRFSFAGYTKHRCRARKRNSGAGNRIKTKIKAPIEGQ